MQISSRFTMAIHMFACIDTFSDQKMTSDFMAASIGTNPVIVRKILQQLKAAGLIEVARGTGGVTILRMRDYIIDNFRNLFLFVIINVKLLKEVVIKKVTKKLIWCNPIIVGE